jgi:hypothetical protein
MNTNDGTKELWLQHRAGQDKYTYFLLAVTASAIAFAVQKTDEITLSYSLIPVGLAVLSWGGSFYCGCKNLIWVQTALMANYSLLQLRSGIHPEQPNNPQHVEAAITGVRSAVESNTNEAQLHAISQFRLAIAGALFFLLWHIIEMYIRTNAT